MSIMSEMLNREYKTLLSGKRLDLFFLDRKRGTFVKSLKVFNVIFLFDVTQNTLNNTTQLRKFTFVPSKNV